MHTDQQLLARVVSGDENGLRELYHRHSAAMLRLLRRLTSDPGTAEEILQESWLAVWRSAGSFRSSASVRAWLLGVARRQAHNRLRRATPPAVEIGAAPEPVDPTADVESQALAAAGHAVIVAAIGRLPEAHRDVVVLALVEELPYADIAEVVGVPVGTVKSRMSKARRMLSEELSRERVN
ncbi:RNA polymerase sigma-70 factor (ECF subfamily) [Lipingzhangella halophila]|uniref:RNA polymerase sigma-70 factor (ECF subfamily) n=1 Tax=Lipingzhangella halophila TaxID=1783352 RepID=A0A7W7RKP9_9ACTN|nr:RNA polymerase sigma factor [Lipingzhangella halophila]MBB4933774.1 RNA polymerase sigma-70 factor (ECF subfamily) [Lipingzhangella halophila]